MTSVKSKKLRRTPIDEPPVIVERDPKNKRRLNVWYRTPELAIAMLKFSAMIQEKTNPQNAARARAHARRIARRFQSRG